MKINYKTINRVTICLTLSICFLLILLVFVTKLLIRERKIIKHIPYMFSINVGASKMRFYMMTPNSSDDLLSYSELIAVTGAKNKQKQAEVLRRAGIFYWPRIDGSIATCWHHIHHPNLENKNQQPDFSWNN